MKLKIIVIAIIALILAYFIIGIVSYLVFSFVRIAAILIVAYIFFLILKKLL
jgi:hypothetical protein